PHTVRVRARGVECIDCIVAISNRYGRDGADEAPRRTGGALLVLLPVAQLDEKPVRLARVHPGNVLPRAVHASAVGPQLGHRARHVLALEADEIDALAVLGQEAAD